MGELYLGRHHSSEEPTPANESNVKCVDKVISLNFPIDVAIDAHLKVRNDNLTSPHEQYQ